MASISARAASITTQDNVPLCPKSAAPWFVDAHARITHEDLGPHFDGLIAAWTHLEDASRYEQGPTNLPNKGRPKQVGSWIAGRHRKMDGEELTVSDPGAYTVKWQAWWDSLQPTWRTRDSDGAWSVMGEYGMGGREWGPLYQWGVNGTLSILASLYFWGRAVRNDSEGQQVPWELAVWDVAWMLEGMAIYYKKF
ncbi:hypothetical protein DFH07DRAFT_733840 [Mycena maculata]|uniref:Uncharacterized protein n=1 Tax=Mycena maculata TaxID=230809 RepID=A0AAD7NS34_9AGAR|nr:hypothetical protein DFH07DRAFT_733840 [Mycena maculata]